jgi:hypothetical protein
MSDLYLELRSRIPVVASRTEIGRDRLEAAQSATGLSNERIARLIPVSEKTWRRWKEAGTVPTYALPRVAEALRLELVEVSPGDAPPALAPESLRVLTELAGDVVRLLDTQGEILSAQKEIQRRLGVIEGALDGRSERPAARAAPSRRQPTP